MTALYGRCVLTLILVLLALPVISGYDICPDGWEPFLTKCYKFVFYPPKTYAEARVACQETEAGLLSINGAEEHKYINDWLKNHDIRRDMWWTSGYRGIISAKQFFWEGEATPVSTPGLWLGNAEKATVGNIIVYKYNGVDYGWSRSQANETHAYICEIHKSESYQIIVSRRDFDYGVDTNDLINLKRGPKFHIKPADVMVVSGSAFASLLCGATSNPIATYKWYKQTTNGMTPLDERTLPNIAVVGGDLDIDNPTSGRDSGSYICEAKNEFGSVLSAPVKVMFGSIGEFSNIRRSPVRIAKYLGAIIECGAPSHFPAANFQWSKTYPQFFIQTAIHPHIFISQNGKLYFSEVSAADNGDYFCMVSLSGLTRGSVSGSSERHVYIPNRTSMPIALQVLSSVGQSEWGPDIDDNFPAVFPSTPLRGQTIKIECFAFGTTPMKYSWSREGGPMPENMQLLDHTRVLVIPDAQLEHSGRYKCSVVRQTQFWARKTIYLDIQSKPFFILPLRDKHVDTGSRLTWCCQADGVPAVTYTWYRNSKILLPVPGEIEVRRNMVVFISLHPGNTMECTNVRLEIYTGSAQAKHNCEFSKTIGPTAFSPTFRKAIPNINLFSTKGGNITIRCRPEASPYPSFQWHKDGSEFGTSSDGSSRYDVQQTGDLHISDVIASDAGDYTCTATNPEGYAFITSRLTVTEGTVINIAPHSQTVIVNNTVFLYCQASYSRKTDLIYTWRFNGWKLDIDKDPVFAWGTGHHQGGIYIRNVQYKNSGKYECVMQSVFDQLVTAAYLSVIGPPSPPGGVYVMSSSVTSYSTMISWTLGDSRGRPVSSVIIEGSTVAEPDWRPLAKYISTTSTYDQDKDRHTYTVHDLKPGNVYRFRVLAINHFGIGFPSLPSTPITLPSSVPVVAPRQVGGGGGAVGLLLIRWEALNAEDLNGNDVGYIVYWRAAGHARRVKWYTKVIYGKKAEFAAVVGKENYYMPYEVKVQSFNSLSPGPNSSVVIVYSAENLPTISVVNIKVDSFNSTALLVTWTAVEDTRDALRGRLGGYQITYQEKYTDNNFKWDAYFSGQRDNAVIIGLLPATYYDVTVQVYNSAGVGPTSEPDIDKTQAAAPQSYPTQVQVHPIDEGHVLVTYRGVTTYTTGGEEPLSGYTGRYWQYGENVRDGRDIDFGMNSQGIIRGVKRDILYVLRVFAYSAGGEGKMSEYVYFTLGGQIKLDVMKTDMVRAQAGHSIPRSCTELFSLVFLIVLLIMK